jgi:hypothetical protein
MKSFESIRNIKHRVMSHMMPLLTILVEIVPFSSQPVHLFWMNLLVYVFFNHCKGLLLFMDPL